MDISVVLIILMLISILIASYFFVFYDLSSSHYANYISTLTLVGTIIAAIIFIYQYKQVNEQSSNDKTKKMTRQLQTDMIDFENTFMQHYLYLSRLYQQMYQDNDALRKSSHINLSKDQMLERDYYEVHMCTIMFQIIENIYLSNLKDQDDLNNPQNIAWINKWKSWFKSQIVREQWNYRKKFFGSDTQKFIDNIINYPMQ